MSWSADDTILFSQGRQGILRVPGNGGAPEQVISVDEDLNAYSPQLLDDDTVLFTLGRSTSGFTERQVVVESLTTHERRVVIDPGSNARYVRTGHLVYALAGSLFAVPFDLASLEVTGGAVPLLEDVQQLNAAQFAISQRGSLAYIPAESYGRGTGRLVWVDRAGRATPLIEDTRRYSDPRLSPDGTRLAVVVGRQGSENRDIWVYEVERGTRARFTVEGDNFLPRWTPDGESITFASYREVADSDGRADIYSRPADVSGPAEPLLDVPGHDFSSSWSPDGQTLAVVREGPGTNYDIWLLPHGGDPSPFVVTDARDSAPVFSPDGRWLAYVSAESGQAEVYVRPHPGPGGLVVVSDGGGTEPMWSPDGGELFYRRGDQMRAVAVEHEPRFTVGSPQALFEGRYATRGADFANYDIASDGQRFLMIELGETDGTVAPAQIVFVENWVEELKARVPTGQD